MAFSWHGIQTGVISGRVSPATEERARQVQHDIRLSGPHRKDSDSGRDFEEERDLRSRRWRMWATI